MKLILVFSMLCAIAYGADMPFNAFYPLTGMNPTSECMKAVACFDSVYDSTNEFASPVFGGITPSYECDVPACLPGDTCSDIIPTGTSLCHRVGVSGADTTYAQFTSVADCLTGFNGPPQQSYKYCLGPLFAQIQTCTKAFLRTTGP